MWWNERFTSWMCSRQICRNCVMLSCQYGPKSLRNVSNTLLNLCHEELRQFWRQKGVQPGTSKVYLIKWPVSVYIYIYIYIYIYRVSLGCSEAGLEPLISCIGGGHFNEEAKWLQSLAAVASASLRSGEWGLLSQHLLAGLHYINI